MKKTVCDCCGEDVSLTTYSSELKFSRTIAGTSLVIDLCQKCLSIIEATLKKLTRGSARQLKEAE